MIYLKTDQEINLMRDSSLLVSRTHAELAKVIKPGINTLYLDQIAEEFIRDNGGVPGFKGYNGFPNTLCISKDSAVVHGIPLDMEVEEGSILSIDCGVLMNDYGFLFIPESCKSGERECDFHVHFHGCL